MDLLNKKVGKITVFVCSITNFNRKCPVVAIMACLPPSKQPKQNESTNPTTFQRPQEVLFLSEGSPFPPPHRRTFSEFGDILALGVGQISNPPLTEGDTEVAGVSPLLKDTKKPLNPNVLCSPFFWIQNYSLLIGLQRYNPLFFWTYKRIL